MKKFEKGLDEGEVIDPRLEAVVERMFERCLEQSHFKQAAGIAFETRRIDVLEQAIRESIEFNKRSKVSESVYMHVTCFGVPLIILHVYLCLPFCHSLGRIRHSLQQNFISFNIVFVALFMQLSRCNLICIQK